MAVSNFISIPVTLEDFLEEFGGWFRQQPFLRITWLDYRDRVLQKAAWNGYAITSVLPIGTVTMLLNSLNRNLKSEGKANLDVDYTLVSNLMTQAYKRLHQQEEKENNTVANNVVTNTDGLLAINRLLLNVASNLSAQENEDLMTVLNLAMANVSNKTPVPEVKLSIAQGRAFNEEFFRNSGVITAGDLPHHPYIVFVPNGDTLTIKFESNTRSVLRYSDETPVMVQWQGTWRSDFFKGTVGEIRDYVERARVNLR